MLRGSDLVVTAVFEGREAARGVRCGSSPAPSSNNQPLT
jgi:hypothetical protein